MINVQRQMLLMPLFFKLVKKVSGTYINHTCGGKYLLRENMNYKQINWRFVIKKKLYSAHSVSFYKNMFFKKLNSAVSFINWVRTYQSNSKRPNVSRLGPFLRGASKLCWTEIFFGNPPIWGLELSHISPSGDASSPLI